MIMTLFLVIDETKRKRKIIYDMEHSNWHHIKILQHLMKHFQYGMFGTKFGTRKDLTIDDIVDIYTNNSNGKVNNFETIKDFRGLNNLDKCSIDGFVIIHLYKSGHDTKQYQDIYVNIGTMEDDREIVMEDFRKKLSSIRK